MRVDCRNLRADNQASVALKKRVPGSPGIRWVPASRTVWHEACRPWEGGPGFPGRPFGRVNPNRSSDFGLNPNRSLDFGEIARLCHAACFSPSRRRSGLRRGVARNRMRTEAGKMPECLIFPIRNGHGVSNDRFGLKWRRSFSCMVLCFLCCQWRLRKRFPTSCFYHDGISVMTEFCKFAF